MSCDNFTINKKHKLNLHRHIYIYIKLDNRIYLYTCNYVFIYSKCKFKVGLYWIIRNVIIYSKYALKCSVLEVTYYIFLQYTFLPVHSSLTYKSHMSDKPSLKILVSAINLQAYQITLLDNIRGVFWVLWRSSRERPENILGCPESTYQGRPLNVRLGRPQDGQIGSLEDFLGTLERYVFWTSWGPIFASLGCTMSLHPELVFTLWIVDGRKIASTK